MKPGRPAYLQGSAIIPNDTVNLTHSGLMVGSEGSSAVGQLHIAQLGKSRTHRVDYVIAPRGLREVVQALVEKTGNVCSHGSIDSGVVAAIGNFLLIANSVLNIFLKST